MRRTGKTRALPRIGRDTPGTSKSVVTPALVAGAATAAPGNNTAAAVLCRSSLRIGEVIGVSLKDGDLHAIAARVQERPGATPREAAAQRKTDRKLAFPSCFSRTEILVRLAGIEPTTPWFVAKYSIQLSYSREALDYSIDRKS